MTRVHGHICGKHGCEPISYLPPSSIARPMMFLACEQPLEDEDAAACGSCDGCRAEGARIVKMLDDSVLAPDADSEQMRADIAAILSQRVAKVIQFPNTPEQDDAP